MLRTSLLVPGLALLALSVSGCPQYYSVDEACSESGRVPGGGSLAPVPEAAMRRLNCYRRLAGVGVASANEIVQVAADGQVAYVEKNPSLDNFSGKLAEQGFLLQSIDAPGFTGISVFERLTDVEHGAGYVFYDLGGTGTWEYIRIEIDDPETGPAPSGEDAVDFLMRDPEFRQLALQPSWVDGAYAELALGPEWFESAGWADRTGGAPVPTGARVYYFVVLYTAPHPEHAAQPVFLPKPDQTDVPLYGLSENSRGVPDALGQYPTVHLSYPITFLVGGLDPLSYDAVNQNQYQSEIPRASIVGPDGPLETEVVHPGDEPAGVWPSAYFQRSIFALYTREPFQPSTRYTVYAELSHPEGDFEIEYQFKTRAEDPGVDASIGRTIAPPTARSAPPSRARILHSPPGSLRPASIRPGGPRPSTNSLKP